MEIFALIFMNIMTYKIVAKKLDIWPKAGSSTFALGHIFASS